MPKIEIDYSNTIIYKITCKDLTVKDVYVGHTTNFVQRKHAHKQSCINDKSTNYNCKLYEVIRNNGGWNNWKMEIINFFNCQDHYEARKIEQDFFVSLNATLNSIEPMPKPKIKLIEVKESKENQIFYCEICNIHCANSNLLESHNNTKKHKKISQNKKEKISNEQMLKCLPQKIPLYCCEICHIETNNKKDFKKHLDTLKHKKQNSLTKNDTYLTDLSPKIPSFDCLNCNKNYKSRTGLWYHQKKCVKEQVKEEYKEIEKSTNNNEISPEIIMNILQQTNELHKLLIELNKKFL